MPLLNPTFISDDLDPVIKEIECVGVAFSNTEADAFLHQDVLIGDECIRIVKGRMGRQGLAADHCVHSSISQLLNRRRFVIEKTEFRLREVLLGGDCSMLVGIFSAFAQRDRRVGLVFLDGHADFHSAAVDPSLAAMVTSGLLKSDILNPAANFLLASNP